MRKVLTSMSGTYNNAPGPSVRAITISGTPTRLGQCVPSTASSLPDCLLQAGSGALRHRQRALSAAARRGHEAELARDAQHVERDAQLAHATVAILMKVRTFDLPAAAGGREARRVERARVRGPTAPMEGGARLTRDHVRPAQQLERHVRKCPPARFEEFTYVGVSSHRLGPSVIAVLNVLGHERQQSVHLMGVPRVKPPPSEIANP